MELTMTKFSLYFHVTSNAHIIISVSLLFYNKASDENRHASYSLRTGQP